MSDEATIVGTNYRITRVEDGLQIGVRGDSKRVKETLHQLRSIRSKIARQASKGTPPSSSQCGLPFDWP